MTSPVEDTNGHEPEKRTRKRKRQRKDSRPVLQAHPLLMNFLEALWVSKLREVELRERITDAQDKPADDIGDYHGSDAQALGYHSSHIENMSSEVAEMILRANGVPDDGTPWHGFACSVGEHPFRYIFAIEPGRVLRGHVLVTTFEHVAARVIVLPAKRLFKVELDDKAPWSASDPDTDNPPPSTPPTEDTPE